MKTISEETFRYELEQIHAEIYLAQHSWYTYLGIRKEISQNSDLLKILNQQPSYWSTILHALQQDFFITTGRILDEGRDTYRIEKFTNLCISNP